MTVAILALQGAFAEHRKMLQKLGVESVLIRNREDWQAYLQNNPFVQGLILPGGESTAMMRILHDEGLFHPIRQAILQGMPVLGTCAGLILLDKEHLNTMDMVARRNAYGRQLGSFHTQGDFLGIGQVPMTFIRAPYIETCGAEVEVLATVEGRRVAARQGNQWVTAFHPELDEDTRIHEQFLLLLSR